MQTALPSLRPPTAPAAAETQRTIHIIDDDHQVGAVLSDGLAAYGYRTVFSSDADQCLADARKSQPDLILCDILMPKKNGHQVLQEFRNDPVLCNRPFVFMTGNVSYAEPRTGMDLGADDFLLKPFSLDVLVSCVVARLNRADLNRQSETRVYHELQSRLSSTLPGEFLTPLTSIIGYAETLETIGDSLTHEERQEYAQIIINSGRRLRRTLRNYLTVLGLDAEYPATKPIALHSKLVAELIGTGARMAAQRHRREKDLILDLETAPIFGSPEDLLLMIEEIADNAFRYSRQHQPVKITAQRQEHQLHISIRDEGRGISPALLAQLSPFSRSEDQQETSRLGLGLSVAQKMKERLHGEWSFSTQPERGTSCRLLFDIDNPSSRE